MKKEKRKQLTKLPVWLYFQPAIVDLQNMFLSFNMLRNCVVVVIIVVVVYQMGEF